MCGVDGARIRENRAPKSVRSAQGFPNSTALALYFGIMKIRSFGVASALCVVTPLLFLTGCGSGTPPQQATSQPTSEVPSAGAPAPPPEPAQAPSASPKDQTKKGIVPRQAVSKSAPAAQSAAATVSGEIKVRTTSALSTKANQAGEAFEASLASPLLSGGAEVLP